MRYEVEANQFVVRIYDDHADNYVASALIRTYGNRGFMSSITGERFYEGLVSHVGDLMHHCKVSTLEGYMTKAHARLLRMELRRAGTGDVTIEGDGMCAGRTMPWVVVTSKILWPHQASQEFGDCNP